MEISASTISIGIAAVSAIIAVFTLIRLYIKLKNSKNITITKSTGERITISKDYSREQSKRLLEFMK